MWSEQLTDRVNPNLAETGSPASSGNGRSNRVVRNLREMGSAPPLRRINGFGFGLYGWCKDQAIPAGYLKLYFFTAFWMPILPICAYAVQNEGGGFRFYHRMSLVGVVRAFGWRVLPFYMTALIEGALWMVLCFGLILLVFGGMHWLRGLF